MEQHETMTCEAMTKPFPERINASSEVPQADVMTPISQIPDDKGNPISEHWKEAILNGLIGAVVVNVNGKPMFLQPKINSASGVVEQLVPAGSHFVRDESTQEPLWRLPAVSGG